jgi:DNA-binding NarL/FixJ family response regulator
MEKIRTIIADDHDLFRDGLRMLLNSDDAIEIVAEAANGVELIEMFKKHKPDVILTDLIMPGKNGVEAISEMRRKGFKRTIAISTFESEYLIVQALEAGAIGYILKNAQKGEIIDAIKTVYKFIPYYCRSTNARLVRLISKSNYNPYRNSVPALFSQREKEMIRLICEEKSSEEIASLLFMSKRTVDGIRARILTKMNVKTVAGVAIYAIKNSIFHLKAEEDTNQFRS